MVKVDDIVGRIALMEWDWDDLQGNGAMRTAHDVQQNGRNYDTRKHMKKIHYFSI
jgi:hypothetical protein